MFEGASAARSKVKSSTAVRGCVREARFEATLEVWFESPPSRAHRETRHFRARSPEGNRSFRFLAAQCVSSFPASSPEFGDGDSRLTFYSC
ncbi:hypothetical protein L484_025740 [Morus notabilis]|uniref:Uncharacterized protein n=1 Tax=Morus notabilis TaxID=981085 RepID=W9RC14_9ROSA|nr:hypothetical protein L484_025740 [Morus notabilis]